MSELYQSTLKCFGFTASSIFRSVLQKSATQKIVLDFSSPNIAKPFHVGHLRSTLIGNFIANLLEKAGHSVVRLNYLGDWGTQFGKIIAGFEHLTNGKNTEQIIDLKFLFDVYVKANALAKSDADFYAKCLKRFSDLESGENTAVEFWQKAREISLNDFRTFYNRLHIRFDTFDSESLYSDPIKQLITQWSAKGFLQKNDEGLIGVVIPLKTDKQDFAALVKSDGSSLYLSRDIAAIIDRFQRFSFDKMYYVVDLRQSAHFATMKRCLQQLEYASLSEKMDHVAFGHIRGMSTRDGNVIFLEDFLEEGKRTALNYMLASPTIRVPKESYDSTAEQLMLTALHVNDMRYRRKADLEFSWESALKDTGNTGLYLQYSYAKLCSLERNCRHEQLPGFGSFDLNLFMEPQAVKLIEHIRSLDDTLQQCYSNLEPHFLVNYLFNLAHLVGSATRVLRINDTNDQALALSRLALFQCCKQIIKEGLEILGGTAVERM